MVVACRVADSQLVHVIIRNRVGSAATQLFNKRAMALYTCVDKGYEK